MTKIKICGLRREEDIACVNEYKPDYVGFVFADSKRKVTKEQAKKLKELLCSDIIAVGVFVNEEIAKVAELVNDNVIDMVQLHGDESEEYIENLRRQVKGVKIIKAVRVAEKEDVQKAENISSDYVLFDTFSGKERGGTGEAFDWRLLKDVEKPFFLAGGIQIDNIKEALSIQNAYALDVSSGVETDGYKDKAKVKTIIEQCRG